MAVRFLLDRSCNPGRTLNKVYCCEGGTFPTDAQLQDIKNKDDPNLPEVNIKVKKLNYRKAQSAQTVETSHSFFNVSYTLVKSSRIYTGQYTFPILLLNDDNVFGEHN